MACFGRSGTNSPTALRVGFLLALGGCLVGGAGAATLYKYTDASGRVVYSDTPPPGNVKAETITPTAPANPQAARELQAKEAEFRKRQQQRADEAAKADKAKTDAARRAQTCAEARGSLKGLQDRNVTYYRVDEAGARIPFDADTRRVEIERLEKFLREQC